MKNCYICGEEAKHEVQDVRKPNTVNPSSQLSAHLCQKHFNIIMGFNQPTDSSLRDKVHYFECACASPEHVLRFVYDEAYSELSLDVFLTPSYGFWKRLWLAINYVLGYKSPQYGHFSNWLMCYGDCTRLKELLEKVIVKKQEARKAIL